MELEKLLMNVIDNGEKPLVLCDINFKVIFLNKKANELYVKKHGLSMLGCSITKLMDEEKLTRLNAAVEWFKESKDNRKVFVGHSKNDNFDVYIKAVRNENDEVIAFYNYVESRTAETAKEYDFG